MKSTTAFALGALLCLGYFSRTRGELQPTVAPDSLLVTTTSLRGDGESIPESTAVLPQKPSATLSSSAAVVLHTVPTSANKTDEPVASASADADANGNTASAHSVVFPMPATSQSSTVAPASVVTNGSAVPTDSVAASETHQTESAVTVAAAATTAAAEPPAVPDSAGNPTQDNSTLSTLPPSTPALATATLATATPPAATQPTQAKAEYSTTVTSSSTTTTTTTTTLMATTAPTTAAATTAVPQSSISPVPGHKKHTVRSTATSSPTTPNPATATLSSAKSTSSSATSTTTTSPTAAPGQPTQAALSELNVGDDDNGTAGVPDPLLAGLVSVFVVAAAIVSLLVFLKFRKRNERPEFRRLQDLPMDDMMEDTPLSMYSY